MATRRDRLMKMFKGSDNLDLVEKLIDQAVKLEEKIDEFGAVLDRIELSPATMKKYRFYHGIYKDNLNQYLQVMKTLGTFAGKLEDEGVSPLREYFERLKNDREI